jgi:hypothetical protein
MKSKYIRNFKFILLIINRLNLLALKKNDLKAEALPRRNTKPSRKDNSFSLSFKEVLFLPQKKQHS